MMDRNRIAKTDRGSFTEEQMKEALSLVLNEGCSVRNAANKKGVAKTTLNNYIKKVKAVADRGEFPKLQPNYACKVFEVMKKK